MRNLFLQAQTIYSSQNHTIDLVDIHTRWTVSEDFAIAFELQHRGKYNWRKADSTRFFLEAVRSQQELLGSALSSKQDNFLVKLFYRLSPIWSLGLQTKQSWRRKDSPPFNDVKLDLIRFFSCNLKLKLSIQHTRAVKFKAALSLTVDKKPLRPKFRLRKFSPSF